ncbi:aromatic-ring-hydroxylating dioxygenase subunit beta [Solwaraspora sp. WMMA2056]|uniref:aromatic-ring-hydroxylating dioxygenase subunit beta n=1 Tax=Solwaraspora sp. WMMA2056 TaxID=3015161 RepID=UPI00259B781A|nr:aromatic-ring-hydroxylating dioxygenase subunit beta [Solwaraspora sp. WMMA2056]WJK43232.1 aromatic-ring-hydroxylating dioxygenase subunit beta [Solwaraspora sp. WMMA2056]
MPPTTNGAVLHVGTREVTRAQVEDFLYREAQLLDEWRLDEWFTLFEADARMEVPTTDWAGWDATTAGFFVCDDYDLIRARVKRLKSRKAHAENPHSRTHRMVSNVILLEAGAETVWISANFLIHRYRDNGAYTYVGRYEHVLKVDDDGLRFRVRRAIPVMESMDPGARLSFIL